MIRKMASSLKKIFTDIETYTSMFSETYINIDVEDWATTKFMKLDDDSQKENPGIWTGICGETCTRHTMTIKADVAQ